MAKRSRNSRWDEVGWALGKDLGVLVGKFRQFETSPQRKCALYEVACARRVILAIPDALLEGAIEFCERGIEEPALFASEQSKELQAQIRGHRDAEPENRPWCCFCDFLLHLFAPPSYSSPTFDGYQIERALQIAGQADPEPRHIATLHDIFGNPFRPVRFSPNWRTSTAVSLARQMYEARDFSAMPILADALQDAGCDNTDILSHCRDTSQVHVRGCWVCDLVLGKA